MTPTLLPYLAGGCLKLLTPLTRRLTTAVVRQRPVVRTATALADLLVPLMATLPQEEVRLVLLDRQLRVLGLPLLYRGTADHLPAMRVSEVFRPAIQAGAVAVVLVHNHVTASATPSVADCAMTDEVIVAGHQFGVEVIDHLIIARGGWYSLRQHGDCEFIPIDHERRDPEAGPSTWDAPAC